jgi:hypothetical protein
MITPLTPQPPTPFLGLLLILLFIIVFSAAAGGAVYFVVHALRPRPQPGDRLGYQQAQIKVQGQADAGEQYVEFSSNQHLPELRLKSEQGDSDYSIDFSGAGT